MKVAIIGAGIAGLTAATLLKDQVKVTLFDKSRGVGGRMSTRRVDGFHFDHGAQYFTARTTEFQAFLRPLIQAGVVQRWDATIASFSGAKMLGSADWSEDEPRYVALPGMNSLAKHIASDLPTVLQTRIASVKNSAGYFLFDEQNQEIGPYDWLIIATPAPQAIQLLPPDFAFSELVASSAMVPCYALMLGFAEPLTNPFDAARVEGSDVAWLSVNSAKPGRPEAFSLLIHSSDSYAAKHLNADPEVIMRHLQSVAGEILGQDLTVAESRSLHRWLYANNKVREPLPPMVDQTSQIAVCGDWCQGGRVEGAFVSALKIVQAMQDSMS